MAMAPIANLGVFPGKESQLLPQMQEESQVLPLARILYIK